MGASGRAPLDRLDAPDAAERADFATLLEAALQETPRDARLVLVGAVRDPASSERYWRAATLLHPRTVLWASPDAGLWPQDLARTPWRVDVAAAGPALERLLDERAARFVIFDHVDPATAARGWREAPRFVRQSGAFTLASVSR